MESCDWGTLGGGHRMCSLGAKFLVLGICPRGHIRERKLCEDHTEKYQQLNTGTDRTCAKPECGRQVIETESCELEKVQ